ncbi:MAG: thioredoxin family protein [Rhodospirillales bacterium]|jgi:small redox-active disulfide protein 2|nr:thioredoxin family protein [Rhodospirillales bacterium]MDK9722030.1 thioredoxin family protein [Rhodospirillales bacterium]
MKDIKVLGGCCGNCDTVMKMFEAQAKALGVEIALEKVTDMAAILGYGVMKTPGVVIDGKLAHAGSVPSPSRIDAWLKE